MPRNLYKRNPRYGVCPKCGEVGFIWHKRRLDKQGNLKRIDCYYRHNLPGQYDKNGHVLARTCKTGTLGSLEELGLEPIFTSNV